MFLLVFVCLCVSKITQKVMDGSFWNFEGMSGMAQTTSDSILGVIRKESWILDHFEILVTIAFNEAWGKPLQNRRWCCYLANNIALAEVCGLWLLSSCISDFSVLFTERSVEYSVLVLVRTDGWACIWASWHSRSWHSTLVCVCGCSSESSITYQTPANCSVVCRHSHVQLLLHWASHR